jgi:hypothetical protein
MDFFPVGAFEPVGLIIAGTKRTIPVLWLKNSGQ